MGTAEVAIKVSWNSDHVEKLYHKEKLFCHNTNKLFVLQTQGEEVYPVVRSQHCLSSASLLWTNITAWRMYSVVVLSVAADVW